MGVRTTWRVDISCDGSSPECPCNSTFTANLHLSASMRLAGRAGWELADLALCPRCSTNPLRAPERAPFSPGLKSAVRPRNAA